MEPESLPLIIGLLVSAVVFYVVRSSKPLYQKGIGQELLVSFIAFLAVFTLLRVVFFLSMEQNLIGLLGGGFGGLVIGLLLAGSGFLDGDPPRDYWTACAVTTASFAVVGLVAGAIISI